MKPFFISTERQSERKLNEIIESVFSEFERNSKKTCGSYWNDREFGSVSWYVKQAYTTSRHQALSSKFWKFLKKNRGKDKCLTMS